jgi:dTDP-4-amino-4,6-dideoxygalactose transaminase
MITFNKPHLTGKEVHYIYEAVSSKHLSGNGDFTKRCQLFFESNYGFGKSLLTTSCTDALEMASILIDIQHGDEVIMPSYTFVSTANAFVLRGATIKFVDSCLKNPNLDPGKIEELISEKTKAIIIVHYAGISCDMTRICEIAERRNIFLIEDAAQAIDSFHNGKALGTFGDLATFSFHETKNIISGEGGMLVVNNPIFQKRAEIIWEKGTNRSAFFRGEVNKYGWVDIGSSFLPSEIIAAFLFAQLEHLEDIQERRLYIWNRYYKNFKPLQDKKLCRLPSIPKYATNNAHMFYLLCSSADERSKLITHLRSCNVHAVFHYLSLHKSPYYKNKHDGRNLDKCDFYSNCLVRLPLFYGLTILEQDLVIDAVVRFYE